VRIVDADTGAPLALLDTVSPAAAGFVATVARDYAGRNTSGRPRMSGLGDRQAMFGTLAPQPIRQRYGCSRSQISRETDTGTWVQIAAECHAKLAAAFPEVAEANVQAAAEVADCWKYEGTGWTSGVLNLTQVLPYHLDAGNLPGSWSAMIGARSGVAGGDLYLPEYGVWLGVGNRSLLCFPGADISHGVTPIVVPRGGWRVTAVFYGLRKCRECADSHEAELARSQARATAGNRAVAAGTSGSQTKLDNWRDRGNPILGGASSQEAKPEPAPAPAPKTEQERLDDLVEFSRIMLAANDLEPWAELLHQLYLDGDGMLTTDEALWIVKLYNAYDSLGSAWQVFNRWRSPEAWAAADDREDAARYECTQERRNLRGGRVLKHLDHYSRLIRSAGGQEAWLKQGIRVGRPRADWLVLCNHLRTCWGTGRQSAFEWAEFLQKVLRWPIEAPSAMLWESEGPRRSIQRLYGLDPKTVKPSELDTAATACKLYLARNGVDVPWEDFETLICDFNVGRDGRYYVGRHLAALREEIDQAPDNAALDAAWWAIVPEPWCRIAPGIDKTKLPVYRDTGRWIGEP
jgi:hypothetical protein